MNIGILASVYGYGPEQIKPWVESLKATKFGGNLQPTRFYFIRLSKRKWNLYFYF